MARLSDSGINGILLSGTIGEFATMSVRERAMLILEARKMSDLPLIAHISSTVEEDMLYLADAAYDSGYDAVMVLPQYYYAQTSRQLLNYFRSLDRKLAGDWFIYNFPARTGCDVDAHLVNAGGKLPAVYWHRKILWTVRLTPGPSSTRSHRS